ncbi:MAG: Rpn family recombination-promoting nuclease/putative transposase [Clostridia bacterium]|nr:Rpn family recombination-promoting nuclease/putative transposase [Clostridia bacterium]
MSENKLLKITNDYIFKRTFGYKESGEVTRVLLRDVLTDDVNAIELNNQTITEKELMDDKVGIMDIKAVLNGSTECDIEMQVVNQHNIEKRVLFYWAKMYTQTIKEGSKYNDLKKSICVLIADFELDGLSEIKKYITKWNIREEEYKSVILTDVLEIVIIELPKYMKYAKKEKRKNLNLWLEFFKNPEVKIMLNENDEKDIKETKDAIKKAQENLEKISKDEHERYLAELREKYIRDQVAVQEYGYIKGREEEKIEIAKKMLENGLDFEIISATTGLSEEEIKKL